MLMVECRCGGNLSLIKVGGTGLRVYEWFLVNNTLLLNKHFLVHLRLRRLVLLLLYLLLGQSRSGRRLLSRLRRVVIALL